MTKIVPKTKQVLKCRFRGTAEILKGDVYGKLGNGSILLMDGEIVDLSECDYHEFETETVEV